MPFSDLTDYQRDVLFRLVNLAKERGLADSQFNVLRLLDSIKIRTSSFDELLVLEKDAEGALKVLAKRGYIDVTREWEHGLHFVFSPQAFRYYEWMQTAEDEAGKKRGEMDTKLDAFLTGQTAIREHLSCFISYSSKDQTFAERLHNDLQDAGVQCWFAPEDMRIGDRIRPAIDRAIQSYDRLLLVLSEHSIDSDWVEKEVETAFEQERKRKTTILFPIRLDSAVMETDQAWAADIRRTRHIGDFTRWKDHDAYQKAFEQLLRDLKAGEEVEADT